MEPEILAAVFEKSIDIAENEKRFDVNPETLNALKAMNETLSHDAEDIASGTSPIIISKELEKIILPGSKGLNVKRSNEEFFIEDVFFRPDGLFYRGKHASQLSLKFKDTDIIVPVKLIIEIPGESKIGYYNYSTGEIEEN
jgi:DEAD/DEAH box helicase domain-containing protein